MLRGKMQELGESGFSGRCGALVIQISIESGIDRQTLKKETSSQDDGRPEVAKLGFTAHS
jgi:hypothetical protein